MLSRRSFLKSLAGVGAVILLPIEKRLGFPTANQRKGISLALAEEDLYAGFVILPEGSPAPSFVQPSVRGVPIVCGVGEGRGGPPAQAKFEEFGANGDVRAQLPFRMAYLPDTVSLPEGGGSILRHPTGEIYGSTLLYGELPGADPDSNSNAIRIWAVPDFPRPFPLWESNSVEPGGPEARFLKVDFLPSDGLMQATDEGYVFYWIDDNVLHTLYADTSEPLASVEKVIRLLIK